MPAFTPAFMRRAPSSCGGRLHHAAGAFMPAFTPGAPSCHIPAAAYRLTNPCCCAAKCRPGCDCCLLGPAPALVYPICFPSPRPGAAAEARRPLTGLPRRHGAAARRTRPSAVAPLTAAVASLAARAAPLGRVWSFRRNFKGAWMEDVHPFLWSGPRKLPTDAPRGATEGGVPPPPARRGS